MIYYSSLNNLRQYIRKKNDLVTEQRKRIIIERHRLKVIHLADNTTIESEEQNGFTPIYFLKKNITLKKTIPL